jgi:Flp pilus assembly protein TadD
LVNQSASLERALATAVDLHQAGCAAEAEAAYRQILQISPNIPEIHNNLGCLYADQGKLHEAVQSYRAALQLNPAYAEAFNNLGNAYKNLEDFNEAINCYLKAIQIKPDNPAVYNNMGAALRVVGETANAAKCFETALTLKPDYAEAYQNLGTVLKEQGKLDEAASSYLAALQLNPQNAPSYVGIGNVLIESGRVDEALQAYAAALALNPDFPEAKWNQALAYLMKGDLEKGWEGHELRLKFQKFYPHVYRKSFWQGENFQGKRLLIYDEIGYGDVFQFIRYLPWVKERGGVVIFECKKGLSRLLENFPGIDELLERSDEPVPEENFDLQLPMESLPGIFHTTLTSIPADVPYLMVDRQLAAEWKNRLAGYSGLKVGLVWAGNPSNQYDSARSCSLQDFASLAAIDGVIFFSLQKGPAEAQLSSLPHGMQIIALGSELKDFADTAAAIESLDIVISVETAVPHLAGALGKEIWTLLSFVPAWRWMLERSDSPWYPTMRLFRKQERGSEWRAVLSVVAEELKRLVESECSVVIQR